MEVPFVPRTIKGMHSVWVFLATNTSHKFGSNMKYFQYFILSLDVQRITLLDQVPIGFFLFLEKSAILGNRACISFQEKFLLILVKIEGYFFLISSAQKLKTEIVIYWQTPNCGKGLVREGRLSLKSHKELWLSKEIMMFSIFCEPHSNFSGQVCVDDCHIASSDNTTLHIKNFFSHCSTKNSISI